MSRRLLPATLLVAGLVTAAVAAESKDADEIKAALAEVGDIVGTWKESATGTVEGRKLNWTEVHTWGWKFKGGDPRIAVRVKDGKVFAVGDLTYSPAKKAYTLTATDKEGKETVYEGKLAGGKLVLTSKDDATGDVTKLSIGTLAGGARMSLKQEVQEKGKGPFTDQFVMNGSKEGEAMAGGGKKNICCVTGGLGTMTVSFGGKTYYVCCTGCRDEFNGNPKKYVDEFEAKNKK